MSRAPSIRCRYFPRFEILEDRRLMSTCHVTRLSDTGAGMGFRGDLRYCINKVNAVPGPDTIDFRVTGTIHLTGALPDLSTDMDIVGPGYAALTVRRNTGGNYRIFTATLGTTVRISGLTATNGFITSGQGGGIHNQGNLTLKDMQVVNNSAGVPLGGGGTGGGIYSSGSLLIQNTSVLYNRASGRLAGLGGGIFSTGPLTVVTSSISGNGSEAFGDVTDNSKAFGAGIYAAGVTTIQYSTISGNHAKSGTGAPEAYGGGIYHSGPLSIQNSTIASNLSEIVCDGDFTGGYALGGGIYSSSTSGVAGFLENSTIANNNLSFGCFIGVGMGGGLYIQGDWVVTHTTIAGNAVSGIHNASTLTLRNSIVAENLGQDLNGSITSSGYNLIENPAGGSGYVPSDLLDVDPLLGPLADNGGPTLTMALLPSSPAIDSGTNHMAPEFDQRGPGFPRIVNGTIDIGAFEVQATGAPSTNLAVLLTADFSRFPFNTRDVD